MSAAETTPVPDPDVDGGGDEPPDEPLATQHLIVLSPGHAPETNVPLQELSPVFRQIPDPDEVEQVFLTQH